MQKRAPKKYVAGFGVSVCISEIQILHAHRSALVQRKRICFIFHRVVSSRGGHYAAQWRGVQK